VQWLFTDRDTCLTTRRSKIWPLPPGVETGPGAHPGAYPTGTAGCFPGEVRVASRGQEIVSVVSQGVRFTVSVASRCVKHKHDELRPAVSKELYQLHRKIWVCKVSKNWKVIINQQDVTLAVLCLLTTTSMLYMFRTPLRPSSGAL